MCLYFSIYAECVINEARQIARTGNYSEERGGRIARYDKTRGPPTKFRSKTKDSKMGWINIMKKEKL